MASGANLSEDQSACLAANLNDDALKFILVAPFDGDSAPVESDENFTTIIEGLMGACPDAMEAAGWS